MELEDVVLGEAGKHISTCTYTHTHVRAHTGTTGSVAYVEAKHRQCEKRIGIARD